MSRKENLERAYNLTRLQQLGVGTVSDEDAAWLKGYTGRHKKRFGRYSDARQKLEQQVSAVQNLMVPVALAAAQSIETAQLTKLPLARKAELVPEELMKAGVDKRLKEVSKVKRENGYVDAALKDGIIDKAKYEALKKKDPRAAYDFATKQVRAYLQAYNKMMINDPQAKKLAVDGLYGRNSQASLAAFNEAKAKAEQLRANVGADESVAPEDVAQRAMAAYSHDQGEGGTFVRTHPTAMVLDSLNNYFNAPNDTSRFDASMFGDNNAYGNNDRVLPNGDKYNRREGYIYNAATDSVYRLPVSVNGVTYTPMENSSARFYGPDSVTYTLGFPQVPDSVNTAQWRDTVNLVPQAWMNDSIPVALTHGNLFGYANNDSTQIVARNGKNFVPIPNDSVLNDTVRWSGLTPFVRDANGNFIPYLFKCGGSVKKRCKRK